MGGGCGKVNSDTARSERLRKHITQFYGVDLPAEGLVTEPTTPKIEVTINVAGEKILETVYPDDMVLVP